MRNDEFTDEEASELIPGDVIHIEPGMTVPARGHEDYSFLNNLFFCLHQYDLCSIPNNSRLCAHIW